MDRSRDRRLKILVAALATYCLIACALAAYAVVDLKNAVNYTAVKFMVPGLFLDMEQGSGWVLTRQLDVNGTMVGAEARAPITPATYGAFLAASGCNPEAIQTWAAAAKGVELK